MKFAWIKAHQREFPVVSMCQALEVSRSGFYAWRRRTPSSRSVRRAALVKQIEAVHRDSRQLYGSPQEHRELLDQSASVSAKTAAKLMHLNDIRSEIARRFVP